MKPFTFLLILSFLIVCSCGKDDETNTISCTDGIQNGDETSIDCGGSQCAPCPILGCTDMDAHNYNAQATQDDSSCETCSDGIQNGDESGVDCGGTKCEPCNVLGCTNPDAHNYDAQATQDDGSCETCTDGVQNGDETGVDCGGATCSQCYSVGDVGPASGLVFYDKGSYSNGWRYLEYGIEIQGGDKEWGCISNVTTSFLLGTGYENTENVLAAYNTNQCDESPEAFFACANLVHNGVDDWYLPSKNEMETLYSFRSQLSLPTKRYWTSSQSNAAIAYVVDFGGEENGLPYSYTWNKVVTNGEQGVAAVVAVRRF